MVKSKWYFDLEYEGECHAYAVAPDTIGFTGNTQDVVWLHWDAGQETMVACDNRNLAEGADAPLYRDKQTAMPASLLTIIIGLLAQDGDAVYFAPKMLKQFIKSGYINQMLVRKAAQALLKYPVVSPAKLVRPLEKDVTLLPVLWPILTESIKTAGAIAADGNAPPVWVNRILDIALRYAPYLAEAAKRGIMNPDDARWEGLSQIALSKAKSKAPAKAQKLLEALA